MGTFRYGQAGAVLELDDQTLDQLRVVIVMKLRRSEGFLLSWDDPDGAPTSVWLNSSIPMTFEFGAPIASPPDRAILEKMMEASFHAAGLLIRRDALARLEFDRDFVQAAR